MDVEDEDSIAVPLLMSLVAGMATGVGALFVLLLDKQPRREHMSFSLAMAAGVMITVSLFDMYLPLVLEEGLVYPSLWAGAGASCFAVLLKILPSPDRMMLPTSMPGAGDKDSKKRVKQWRLAMIMMVTLTAHNFPEGLAVSVSNLKSDSLGLVVTLSIALHNVPEGLSIAVPIYAATGRKQYAISMAFLSGLSEPLGAFFALTVLRASFMRSPWLVNYVLCLVAGIMLSVSFQELIPEALAYNHRPSFVAGFSLGAAIMLLTIYLQPG